MIVTMNECTFNNLIRVIKSCGIRPTLLNSESSDLGYIYNVHISDKDIKPLMVHLLNQSGDYQNQLVNKHHFINQLFGNKLPYLFENEILFI